jgi:hypothetical protein
MGGVNLLEAFRYQAVACAQLGSPMYTDLLTRLHDDIRDRGGTIRVLRDHEDDSGPSALALRLLGAVHRVVLSGQAPELAAFYPNVGGPWDPGGGWPAFQAVLSDHETTLRVLLDRAPQTNEVGRAAALMGGLLIAAARYPHPIRLFEIGASGGLNQLADQFCYADGDNILWGNPGCPVRLDPAWRGVLPDASTPVKLVERLANDIHPVDVTTEDGKLTLMSYVWPDQVERFARIRAALQIAAQMPPTIVGGPAGEFIERIALVDSTATVVWHSVMWQYLDVTEQSRITGHLEHLGRQATPDDPLVHLRFEPMRREPCREHEFVVMMDSWPGRRGEILGIGQPHGIPVEWEPRAPDKR